MKNAYSSIVIEGTDLIGKTNLVKYLKTIFSNVSDRDPNISKHIGLEFNEESARVIESYMGKNADTLFVFLIAKPFNAEELLSPRMKIREPLDEYDAHCIEYNLTYFQTFEFMKHNRTHDNYNSMSISLGDNDYLPYDLMQKIAQRVVQDSFMEWGLDEEPTIKGESKRIYKLENANISVISMVPSLYSFTFNRYDMVPGTDELRSKLWKLFGTIINRNYHRYLTNIPMSDKALDRLFWSRGTESPLISSYLGTVDHIGNTYNIALWEETLPPIEVVWKQSHYGTMKHNLKGVDQWPTRNNGTPIHDECQYPIPFIRFDWRNPLPDKDECIPDEFANFYVDVENSKSTVLIVTKILQLILAQKGYNLIDLCYFINEKGTTIFSEITPDGMRIQKSGDSFDKDLWRTGKAKSELVDIWQVLYDDLKELEGMKL